MLRSRFAATASTLAFALAALVLSGSAEARRNGIVAGGCDGCHGNVGATLDVSASPVTFNPGDEVTFSVTIRRATGSIVNGGVYIENPGAGELRALTGEGLTRVPNDGFTHSQPKAAQGNAVTFRFAWRAPATPGGVTFDVYGLATNGDGRSSGDAAGTARFEAAFGCPGEKLYYDSDGDGFGNPDFDTLTGCVGAALPERFARLGTDCNENDAQVHPGAVEKCNRKDDDCNGQIDENADPVELWPDEDGDGYYATKTGTPLLGCTGMPNYAAESGDCAPRDPRVHRGATEICNLLDDNCDGRSDERTRPQCGIGFCRAESFTCVAADCVPSSPLPERCNLLDDDCDGETDEGELCASGEACLAGQCVTLNEPSPQGGSSSGGRGPQAGAAGQQGGRGASAPSGGADGDGSDRGGSCEFSRRAPPETVAWGLCLLLAWGCRRRTMTVSASAD